MRVESGGDISPIEFAQHTVTAAEALAGEADVSVPAYITNSNIKGLSLSYYGSGQSKVYTESTAANSGYIINATEFDAAGNVVKVFGGGNMAEFDIILIVIFYE